MYILLLLSRFSRVRLSATPKTAAHQAPPSLGFSRQEHWSELPFPSPMHESEKWKVSRSVVSDSLRPHGLQPTRLLCPWDFLGKNTGVGCHRLLRNICCFICSLENDFTMPQISLQPPFLPDLKSSTCRFCHRKLWHHLRHQALHIHPELLAIDNVLQGPWFR